MIQEEKYQNALRTLNSIVTRARWMAQEREVSELAELLDIAEQLPKFIAQADDATEEFRAVVEDISRQFPICSHLSEEFNRDYACAW